MAAGGFKGIYSGLRVAALGSVPGAALFFSTYETMKHTIPNLYQAISPNSSPLPEPVIHMTAAGLGELVACLVRVPTDVVKQRYQAKMIDRSTPLTHAIASIYKEEGLVRGFYTGYFSTILRELPFSFIQFPIYEAMKVSNNFTLLTALILDAIESNPNFSVAQRARDPILRGCDLWLDLWRHRCSSHHSA